MLINFKVSGFCSIKDPIELSLEPFYRQRIGGTKYEKNYIDRGKHRIAKSVIVFGNNASGKTNLLLALEFCVNFIQGIVVPVVIDKKRTKTFEDSVKGYLNRFSDTMFFELEVDRNGNVFQYGIGLSEFGLVHEYLYKNRNLIYEFNEDVLSLPGRADIEAIYSVPSSSPMIYKLRDFLRNDIDGFIEAIKQIEIYISGPFNEDSKWTDFSVNESGKIFVEQNIDRVLAILQTIDSTISEVSFQLIQGEDGEDRYAPRYYRHCASGKCLYPFSSESQGVKKITGMLMSLLRVLDGDRTFVVDEFDSSISTRSLLLIYRSLIHSDLNKKGQLIVTSHNLELLDMDMFASSQVYCIYKTKDLTTAMNSLGDFNLRSDKKRLALRFLRGDFEV